MQTNEYTAKIIEIIADQLELDPSEISESDLLVDDHGADSLALIGVLAALEKEFRVSIDQEDLGRMVNVHGIRAVLADAAGW